MVLPAAVGTLAALGTFISLLVNRQLSNSEVATILILGWAALVHAGYAAVQGLQDHLGPAPVKTAGPDCPARGVRDGIGLAPHGCRPLVVRPGAARRGRPPAGESVSLRLSALLTCSTWLLYLGGPLVGGGLGGLPVVAAAARTKVWRVESGPGGTGDDRRRSAYRPPPSPAERVTTLLYESPADEVHFTCGLLGAGSAGNSLVDPNRSRP